MNRHSEDAVEYWLSQQLQPPLNCQSLEYGRRGGSPLETWRPVQPLGAGSHCGHGAVSVCNVESSDTETFSLLVVVAGRNIGRRVDDRGPREKGKM